MTQPSILVTGATGMLGRALMDAWQERYHVRGASCITAGEAGWVGDLAEPDAARRVVEWASPSVVVHTAAWTDVDGCEREPARAWEVNAAATRRLALATREAGAAFVYISTSAVFDGRDGAYDEASEPNPVNVYGKTKLAGERAALDVHPESLVLRVSLEGWRAGPRPGFVQWIVEGLARGEPRRVCTDWIHSICFAANLPALIDDLWRSGRSGVFHVGAAPALSNWQLANRTADMFALDCSLLTPIEGSTLRLAAERPRDCSLTTTRQRERRTAIWSIDEGLARLRDDAPSRGWWAA